MVLKKPELSKKAIFDAMFNSPCCKLLFFCSSFVIKGAYKRLKKELRRVKDMRLLTSEPELLIYYYSYYSYKILLIVIIIFFYNCNTIITLTL